jgi:hypothetical protein
VRAEKGLVASVCDFPENSAHRPLRLRMHVELGLFDAQDEASFVFLI